MDRCGHDMEIGKSVANHWQNDGKDKRKKQTNDK